VLSTLGCIRNHVGDSAGAIDALREARSQLAKLVAPDAVDWNLMDFELADLRLQVLESQLRGDDGAVDVYHEHIGKMLQRALRGRNPWFALQAMSYMTRAGHYLEMAGRNDEALLVSGAAVHLAASMVEVVKPHQVGFSVAESCGRMARMEFQNGFRSEARRLMAKAIDAAREAEKIWPTPYSIRATLGLELQLSDFERRVGLASESRQRLNGVIEHARAHLAVPSQQAGLLALCELLESAANIEAASGSLESALALRQEALRVRETIDRNAPETAPFQRTALRDALRVVRDLSIRLRRFGPAREFAERALQLSELLGLPADADRSALARVRADGGDA
jgi:hypothetical protein